MGYPSEQQKMAGLKDTCSTNDHKASESPIFKQPRTQKEDEQIITNRVKIWLEQTKVPLGKHVFAVTVATNLRTKLNIDITVPGTITSLFITHRAEPIPLNIASALVDMHFKDKISQARLHLLLSWGFYEKYPPERFMYSSRLTLNDLEELRAKYKTKKTKTEVAQYLLPPERALPDSLVHRNMLEQSRASPYHPQNTGQSRKRFSSAQKKPMTPAHSASPSKTSFGNLSSPAPSFGSRSCLSTNESVSPLSSISSRGVKRERSPNSTPDSTTSMKSQDLAGGIDHKYKSITLQYTLRRSELATEKFAKEARLYHEQIRLGAEEKSITDWYEKESRALEEKEAEERARLAGN